MSTGTFFISATSNSPTFYFRLSRFVRAVFNLSICKMSTSDVKPTRSTFFS